MAITESDISTYLCMLQIDNGEKKRIQADVLEFSELYLEGKTWPSESDYEEYRRMKSKKAHDSLRGENAERRVRGFIAYLKGETEMSKTEKKQNDILESEESTSITTSANENEENPSQDSSLESEENTSTAESAKESEESTESYKVQESETEKKHEESTLQDINLESKDKGLQEMRAIESKKDNNLEKEVSEKTEKKIGRPRKSKEARENKVNLYLTDSMMADVKALQALRGITSVTDYIIAVLSDEIIRKQNSLKKFQEIKEY